MEGYKKVNVLEYVSNGLKEGKLVPFMACKYARIIARQGVPGEVITTWSVNEKGESIKERESTVTIDPETGNPGWVVTKATEDGEVIIDIHGKDNTWIISDSVFRKKYEVADLDIGMYKPKGGIQKFVEVKENIILNQWGKDTKIAQGGYINITNIDDMYGISKRDFQDTYKIISEDVKVKK